jgi:hypothetical protein
MLISKHRSKAEAKKAADAHRSRTKQPTIFFYSAKSEQWEVRSGTKKGKK